MPKIGTISSNGIKTIRKHRLISEKADKCLNHPLKHLEEEIDTTQVVKLTNIVQYRSALIRESRKIVDREEANIEAMVRAYLLTKDEVYYKEGIKRLSEILLEKKKVSTLLEISIVLLFCP